jgi:transcriptional regulator with PAS, ATPase and Fis domain
VKSGNFREDLYYRIACFCIRIPPLRERLEDIPVLCEEILQRIAYKTGRAYRLTEEAIHYLSGYNYPGNIRELRNILQVAVAHSADTPGGVINGEKVKQHLRMRDELEASSIAAEVCELKPRTGMESPLKVSLSSTETTGIPAYPEQKQPFNRTPTEELPSLKNVEARHIADLLRLHGGNRRIVAEAMGISERTLYRKLKRYDLSAVR